MTSGTGLAVVLVPRSRNNPGIEPLFSWT